MNSDVVNSPVTGGNARRVGEIDVAKLLERYEKDWGLDVSAELAGYEALPIFACDDTGYRFFHPSTLAGGASFYDRLWSIDIGHRPEGMWRDDQQWALDAVKEGERAVDVGCADGILLSRLAEKTPAVGVEESEAGRAIARQKGLEVHGEALTDFARDNPASFDVVITLQVLEHVYDVSQFMTQLMALTKPGGRILISVPNNDPWYAGWMKYEPLNNPPHHIGLWNRSSLERMARYLQLEVLGVSFFGPAASLPVRSYYRTAGLANIARTPKQLSKSDWFKVLALAPLGGAMALFSYVLKKSAYGYVGVALRKPA